MGRIAAVAVVAALCAVLVRKQSPEVALALSLAGVAWILSRCIPAMIAVKTMVDTLREAAGLSPVVVAPVLKTVGVAVLTRFAAELCRDAKEGGLATFVETAGSVFALVLALPLLQTVLSMLTELLE